LRPRLVEWVGDGRVDRAAASAVVVAAAEERPDSTGQGGC
jgi:hypothetical protein